MKKRLLTMVALSAVVSAWGAVSDTIDILTSQLPYKTEDIFGSEKVYRLTVDELTNVAVSCDYKEFAGSETSGFVGWSGNYYSVKQFTVNCGEGYVKSSTYEGKKYLINPFCELHQYGVPYVLKIDKVENIKYNSDSEYDAGDTITKFPFVETGNAKYIIDKTTAGVTVLGTSPSFVLKATEDKTVFHLKSKHGLFINSNVVWDYKITLNEGEKKVFTAVTTDDEYDLVVDKEDACPLIAEKAITLPFEGTMKPNIVCNQEDNYGYFYQAYTFNLEEESFIKASTTSGDFEIKILDTNGEEVIIAGNSVSEQKLSVGKYYLVQYGRYKASDRVELKTISEDEFTDRNEVFEVSDLPFDSELIVGKTTYGEINVAKDTFISSASFYTKSFFVHLEAGKAYTMVSNFQTKAASKNSYFYFMVAKDLASDVVATGLPNMRGTSSMKAQSGQFGVTETGDYIVLLVYDTKQDGQYSILVEEVDANARYLVFGEEEQETVDKEKEANWSFYVPQDTVIEISLKSECNKVEAYANDSVGGSGFTLETPGDYKVRLSQGMYDLTIINYSNKSLTYQLRLNICGEKVQNDTCTLAQLLADAELTDGFALKTLSRDCAPVKYVQEVLSDGSSVSNLGYKAAYKMELKEGELVSVFYSCDLYTLEDEATQAYKKVQTLYPSTKYKAEKDGVYYFVFSVSEKNATESISLKKETNVMSLEDYLATLSEVSLDYTDSVNVDYSKIPLVDFGKYKTSGATMYYCIGYKLSLESDNIFREKTDLRADLFFIKETESGFEIVDYDYYYTYSKKIESTGIYYFVLAYSGGIYGISDVVSMSVNTKDGISLETLLSQAETLEGERSFTLNYGSDETSLVLGEGDFGGDDGLYLYYSKAFKVELKAGQTLRVRHDNVELDDYTYIFGVTTSGITKLGDFDDYESVYASYRAEYAGTVYLVLSTYGEYEIGTADYQIDIIENENITSIVDAFADAEVLNDRGKNVKVETDERLISLDGEFICYHSKIYKREMASGQTVVFYADQPSIIEIFNIVDGEENIVDEFEFTNEDKEYGSFNAEEAGMYYFMVTPMNSSSIQLSYDFSIDYAEYATSAEISTSSFQIIDSLIPFQSPLVDDGTNTLRMSKMHTCTFEDQTTVLCVKKGDFSSYSILPEYNTGYDVMSLDAMVVSYAILDAGTYNFAAYTEPASYADDDREVKVDYTVYPLQTMDTVPYCDAKEIDLTYIYDKKSLFDDDDVMVFSQYGVCGVAKAMKVRLEEGEQIIFADNSPYLSGMVGVEIFGVENGKRKNVTSFAYYESTTFSYVAQKSGYYYITYQAVVETALQSVISFSIKKADAGVIPIVKMTPSVDYVSSREVDSKAAVLMALAEVNAVAETEDGKTFSIDNTNITWTLDDELTMATGVVACPEDYSVEKEEISIVSVDLNPSFITITTDGNGTVDNETIKVHRGSIATINVKANEGFNVAEITVGGEVVGNSLVGTSGGKFEFTADETYLNVSVKFQPTKTSVEEVLSQNVNIYGGEQVINIVNAKVGSPFVIYNLTGAVVKQATIHSDVEAVSVAKAGLYIVKVDNKAVKVIVR